MPFTAAELDNIANSALDYYIDKGRVHTQNVQNKPMMRAFEASAGNFSGGKGFVSLTVKSGQGGLTLLGYTHDDRVTYGNPTPTKRVNYSWKEHFIGMGLTHTELKQDGITVVEADGGGESLSNKSEREMHVLAEIFDEKINVMDEDYAASWDLLIHGDGTSDAKAVAGIRSFVLDNPGAASTGGLSRSANVWWRNRAATTAAGNAGTGAAPIVSSAANGGTLLQFLQKEERQLARFATGRRSRKFAGSDFLDAYERELRANGQTAQTGFTGGDGTVDGAMPQVRFNGVTIEYDPTLDNLGLAKRMYDLDMSKIKLMYMAGERKKKVSPARPHDHFVLYRGVTSTAVMCAKQLNSSAVYDIA